MVCWTFLAQQFVGFLLLLSPVLPLFTSQDSSSVIQFVTRARLQVDHDLRVVEVPNGSPEEKLVSTQT